MIVAYPEKLGDTYPERRSQQDIVLSILEKALEKVKMPKENRK